MHADSWTLSPSSNATYSNNWAEYLVQVIGSKGAVAILSMLWVDSTCATASCFMSAQVRPSYL